MIDDLEDTDLASPQFHEHEYISKDMEPGRDYEKKSQANLMEMLGSRTGRRDD